MNRNTARHPPASTSLLSVRDCAAFRLIPINQSKHVLMGALAAACLSHTRPSRNQRRLVSTFRRFLDRPQMSR
jgi:hypothetical protein